MLDATAYATAGAEARELMLGSAEIAPAVKDLKR